MATRPPAIGPEWLRIGPAVADVAALVPDLDLLARVAAKAGELARALAVKGVPGDLSSPDKVFSLIVTAIERPEIKEAFAAAGLGDLFDSVRNRIARFTSPDQPWARMLLPVSAFSESYDGPEDTRFPHYDEGSGSDLLTLAIPPRAATVPASAGVANVTLSASGVAALHVEPGALWPFPKEQVAPGLLRLGLKGDASLGASATAPFGGAGSLDVRAKGAVDLAASMFFRPEASDVPVAAALVSTVTAMADPFDLDSLRAAMASGGLEGVVLRFAGSAETGLAVAIGRDFDIPQVASGEAGLTASVTFSRSTTWLLSLRSTGEDALHFVLSREVASEDAWTAGLDLSVDATPLAGRLSSVIVAATGKWGDLLDQVKPFLTPGTFARERLAAALAKAVDRAVGDPALAAALLSDAGLAGATGATVETAVADLARDRLANALDAAGVTVLTSAAGAMDALCDRLLGSLPPAGQQAARTAVQAELRSLVGEVRSSFERQVGSLVSADARKVRQELTNAGVAVDHAVDDADAATRGVRELVERVQGAVTKATQAAAEGLARKLGARFGWSGSSTRGAHYELAGEWRGDRSEFTNLWRSLATGRLQPFQRLLSDPATLPPGMTLDPASSLSRFAGARNGFDLEIVAFGVNVGIRDVVEARAEISLSANGDVTVSVRGEAGRTLASFRESRSATFLTSWDIVAGRLAGDASRFMDVSLSLEHSDKSLDLDEATGLVSGLAGVGLISQARVARLVAEYQRWKVLSAASGGKPRGSIMIRMTPPGGVGEAMVSLGRLARDKRPGAGPAIFQIATTALVETGFVKQKDRDDDCAQARREFEQLRNVVEPERIMFALRSVDLAPANGVAGSANDYSALRRLISRADDLLEMLQQTALIHDAEPAADAAAPPGTWDARKYEDAEKRLSKAASHWLDLNSGFIGVVFGIKKAVSPSMLALFAILARLASTPAVASDPPSMKLQDWRPDDADGWFRITMKPDGGEAIAI